MPEAATPAWLLELAARLGDAGLWLPGVNASAHDLQPHEQDWRGRYHGKALALARPANTEEVADVVRACAAHGVSIVPQGGNTGLVGGGIPDATGKQVVLSLQRMNQVMAVDPANLSMTVQAGCTLAQVQDAAQAHDLLFPLSLAAEGTCTIGGNLATNAGGTQVLRFGTARELCLGLEVVTAQGEVWSGLSALRKNNTGYDLRDLYIGSEGTLGIITAASLKLFPCPASRSASLIACPSLEACIDLLQMTRRAFDAQLTAFEVMARMPVALVEKHLPDMAQVVNSLNAPEWTVLLELSHTNAHAQSEALPTLLAQALAEGHALDAIVCQTEAQRLAMWALREAIPMAEKAEGLMVKHDIGVPTSQVPAFVREARAALAAAFPGHQLVCFGHLGDGNLHFNVGAPAGEETRAFVQQHEADINQLVYDVVARFEGTISAEHGIGQLKRNELAQRQSPTARALMRSIKHALDPLNTMNPGRLL